MRLRDLEKVKQFLKTDSDIARSNVMTAQARLEDAKNKKNAMNQAAYKSNIDISNPIDQMGAGAYLRFTAMRSNLIDKDIEQMEQQVTDFEDKLFDAIAEEKKIEHFAEKIAKEQKKKRQSIEDEMNDFIGMIRHIRR